MAIKIKRIYEQPLASDGCRFLVDRLWPRGIAKSTARIDEWLKELAPSDALRKWFRHKPERWEEFQERYRSELQPLEKQKLMRRVGSIARNRIVTLLYAAKDEEHNNARALANFIKGK